MVAHIKDVCMPLQSKHPSCILVLAFDPFIKSQAALHALEQALDSPHRFPHPEAAHHQQQLAKFADSPAASSYILVEAKIPDSIASIFHISVHAHRFGWSRIILADSLSSKQILGTTREGQDKQLSVVVVEISPATSSVHEGNATEHGSIVAKRFSLKEIKDLTKAGNGGKWINNLPKRVEKYPHISGVDTNSFYNTGIPLYNPQLPIFDHALRLPANFHGNTATEANTEDFEDQKADQALKAMRGLPFELVHSILDAYSVETDLDKMSSAPNMFEKLTAEQMEVHVLYYLPHSELVKLEESINKIILQNHQERRRRKIEGRGPGQSEVADNQTCCRLHPWRALHPASLLDAWNLFQRWMTHMLHPDYPAFAFLLPQVAPDSEHSLQIGIIQRSCSFCPWWNLLPAAKAYDIWYNDTFSQNYLGDEGTFYSNPPNLEFGLDYSSSFYWEPPRFISMAKGPAAPVFLLTKHLSQYELRQVLEEIEIMTDDDWCRGPKVDKHYVLVPWQRDTDGNLDDAWQLAWEVAHYAGDETAKTGIFIDKQSAEDKTVMISHLM